MTTQSNYDMKKVNEESIDDAPKFNYLLKEITELGEVGGYFFLFMLVIKVTPAKRCCDNSNNDTEN